MYLRINAQYEVGQELGIQVRGVQAGNTNLWVDSAEIFNLDEINKGVSTRERLEQWASKNTKDVKVKIRFTSGVATDTR